MVVINRLLSVTIQGHLTYQSCTERNSARVLQSLNYVGICTVILSDFSVILLMEEILHQFIPIPLFTGFYTSQVVQDFFHQQYFLKHTHLASQWKTWRLGRTMAQL